MDHMRKEVIIQEINFWKNHKMLPETYCDFLLTLYSGEGQPDIKTSKPKSHNNILICLFLGILIGCNLVLNYFTHFSFAMQMTAAVISVILLTAFCFYTKNRTFLQIGLLIGALLFVLSTVQAAEYFQLGNVSLFTMLLANCALWIFIGKKFSLSYFWIAGFLGLSLVTLFIAKLYNIF